MVYSECNGQVVDAVSGYERSCLAVRGDERSWHAASGDESGCERYDSVSGMHTMKCTNVSGSKNRVQDPDSNTDFQNGSQRAKQHQY